MKILCSILALSCICMSTHAQIPWHNSLKVELNQTGFSYTTDSTRNDYYPEFNVKQNNYKFVHDADSSYMVGEIPIAFSLTHQMPSFQGGGLPSSAIGLEKRYYTYLITGRRIPLGFPLILLYPIMEK